MDYFSIGKRVRVLDITKGRVVADGIYDLVLSDDGCYVRISNGREINNFYFPAERFCFLGPKTLKHLDKDGNQAE